MKIILELPFTLCILKQHSPIARARFYFNLKYSDSANHFPPFLNVENQLISSSLVTSLWLVIIRIKRSEQLHLSLTTRNLLFKNLHNGKTVVKMNSASTFG